MPDQAAPEGTQAQIPQTYAKEENTERKEEVLRRFEDIDEQKSSSKYKAVSSDQRHHPSPTPDYKWK